MPANVQQLCRGNSSAILHTHIQVGVDLAQNGGIKGPAEEQ